MNVIDIIDYSKTCRSCLTNTGDMKPFSDPYSPEKSVNEVFCAITLLKCSDDTVGLPAQICNVCYSELNQSFNFVLKCRASDKKLRAHLEQTEINDAWIENTSQIIDSTDTSCLDVNHITIKSEIANEFNNLLNEELHKNNHFPNYSETGNKLLDKEIDIVKHEVDIVKMEAKHFINVTDAVNQSMSSVHASEINEEHPNVVHQDEKPHSCTKCDKSYHTKLNLYYHLSRHALKNSYSCTICERSYNRKDSLASHMRMHSEKPYSCTVCNKTFSARSSLFDHKRTHTGEKPYSCTVCDKSFRGRFHLEYHLRTHTSEKPYACSICDKSYRNHSHLKDHLLTHSGERPYSCTVCSKTFTRNPALTVHMRRHTSEIPYSYITSQ